MKKKVLSAILSVAMVAALLVGCGNAAEETEAPAATEEAPAEEAPAEEAEAPAEDAAPQRTLQQAAVHTHSYPNPQVTRSTRDRQPVLRKRWQISAEQLLFSIPNPLRLMHRSQ